MYLMFLYISLTVIILNINSLKCASIKKNKLNNCQKISPVALARVLGSAFNPRYMSLVLPSNDELSYDDSKREIKGRQALQFFVENDFEYDNVEVPAWNLNLAAQQLHLLSGSGHDNFDLEEGYVKGAKRGKKIARRAVIKPAPQWKCKSEVKWIDLGDDYFPRFLRTVECPKSTCWYGRYTCKPRAFTVNLLKRIKDKCDESNLLYHNDNVGLPRETRELWIWEERAVNFCCDCSL